MRPVALAVALGSALFGSAVALVSCSPFGGNAFNCTDSTQCGPGGTCQPNGFCSVTNGDCDSGQSYENAGGLSGTCVPSGTGEDAPVAPPDEPTPVVDAPCIIQGVDTCAFTDPVNLDVTANDTINTDTGGGADPRCRNFPQSGGPDACLVFASNVKVAAGVTLRGIGSRPLIIVSQGGMTIDGTIDVGSTRNPNVRGAGRDFPCTELRAGAEDLGGAGGGSGGSFRGKGGDGGTGDSDNSQNPAGTALGGLAPDLVAAPPTFARGGCNGFDGGDEAGGGAGDGGNGGSSGGAIWLLANGTVAIATTGGVRATGAGGSGGEVQAGGGGGGSGGYIKIAASAVMNLGILAANGGGGGEGGCRCNGLPITGDFGGDGNLSGTAANGGDTTGMPGGDGGLASASALNGNNGGDSVVGGGGGGGGAGYIVLVGTVTNSGTISPGAVPP